MLTSTSMTVPGSTYEKLTRSRKIMTRVQKHFFNSVPGAPELMRKGFLCYGVMNIVCQEMQRGGREAEARSLPV
jgi:hypothetical protein